MATRIARVRRAKFEAQRGRCHYCDQPMWTDGPEGFCRDFGMSPKAAAAFQCTAEHLVPRSDGGPDRAENIVAACQFCNATRHSAKRPLTPDAYRSRVQARLRAGRWRRLPVR